LVLLRFLFSGVLMMTDKSIFGLRFGANVSIQPTQDELLMFLRSRKKEDRPDLQGSVLATYNDVLERVLLFQSGQLLDVPAGDEHDKMFYGVLCQSCFFNRGLKSAVEQYKYHLHALGATDVRKARAFIEAAGQEISLLNQGRKADAARRAKIQDLVDERKKALETFTSRRPAMVKELGHLALYIRDNLFKIAKRCETSIVILVGSTIERMKEKQLIEDVKLYLKEQLEYDLHDGFDIAGQRLENAKKDFAFLSREISNSFTENIFALTQLYESIYDHTLKTALDIDALMAENRRTRNRSVAEEIELFTRIEKVLDSLISAKRFELKATEGNSITMHKNVFRQKRREMFDYLFMLMQKDRRSWMRRSLEKRRSSDDLQYQQPSRRSGRDRRAGKDRRKILSFSA
jgi:hypothetical protein